MTQLEITTSTLLAGRGISSIMPLRKVTFSMPASALLRSANCNIASVMSRPYAFPPGPTRFAESNTSIPPPDPKSNTISPAFSCASAVGFPQPSEAATAPAAKVRRASVEAGARVDAGAIVEDSVLLPGARVGAGCEVRGSILGPGVELPAGTHVTDQIVVAGGHHSDLRPR